MENWYWRKTLIVFETKFYLNRLSTNNLKRIKIVLDHATNLCIRQQMKCGMNHWNGKQKNEEHIGVMCRICRLRVAF